MNPTDAEYARIRAVVHEWADRVARGEKMPPYGFDADAQDIRHKQEEAEGKAGIKNG